MSPQLSRNLILISPHFNQSWNKVHEKPEYLFNPSPSNLIVWAGLMFPVSLLSKISREKDYVPYVARQNHCVQIMGNYLRRQIGLRGPLPLPARGIFADEGNLSLPTRADWAGKVREIILILINQPKLYQLPRLKQPLPSSSSVHYLQCNTISTDTPSMEVKRTWIKKERSPEEANGCHWRWRRFIL